MINSNNDITIYSNQVLSIEHYQKLSGTIYPNPNKGRFSIYFDKNLGYSIEIYDINGRVLKILNRYSNNKVIDISDYDSGIYIVKIVDNNNNNFIKIIKI